MQLILKKIYSELNEVKIILCPHSALIKKLVKHEFHVEATSGWYHSREVSISYIILHSDTHCLSIQSFYNFKVTFLNIAYTYYQCTYIILTTNLQCNIIKFS